MLVFEDIYKPIQIFFEYSKKDQRLKDDLENQLFFLESPTIKLIWKSIEIDDSLDFYRQQIEKNKNIDILKSSEIIVFLVSSSFCSTLKNNADLDYLVDIPLSRKENNRSNVIPVILDFCSWKKTKFGGLEPLPENGIPVRDRNAWTSQSAVLNQIAESLGSYVDTLTYYQENCQKYDKNLSQYRGIVVSIYKQETVETLSEKSRQILEQHQEYLDIKACDAEQVQSEIELEFKKLKNVNNFYSSQSWKDRTTDSDVESSDRSLSVSETNSLLGFALVLVFTIGLLGSQLSHQSISLKKLPRQTTESSALSLDDFQLSQAQNFADIYLTALNSNKHQKAWSMYIFSQNKNQELYLKYRDWWTQKYNIEHMLSKVTKVDESDTKRAKLYVEWLYCEKKDENLYFATELWWLQWHPQKNVWLLTSVDEESLNHEKVSTCQNKN